jgi:hypothetical protein
VKNGNGIISRSKTAVIGDILKESAGLGVAEITSSAVSLGVIGIADQIAPGLVNGATKAISKVVVEPYLETIEKVMGTVCRLEECKPDKTKSRQERAEQLAHSIVLFSAAFVPSFLVKVAVRRGINQACGMGDHHPWWKVWKANTHDKKVVLWDEGVHIGSLILLNTGVAKYTDDLIRSSTSILTKTGISQKKAHEIASMAMIWELPNIMGLMAGTGVIAHKHIKSHVDQLSHSTALGGHTHTP